MIVIDLIKGDLKEGEVKMLENFVVQEDISMIRSLTISKTTYGDTFFWSFIKSGSYTAKSGCWVAKIILNNEENKVCSESSITKFQAFAWRIKTPQKIRHLIWQLITCHVEVTKKLNRRHVRCNIYCHRCGEPTETVTHAIFECPPGTKCSS